MTDAASLAWSIDPAPQPHDLAVISEGVFAHGRAAAHDSDAAPLACFVREQGAVVAGVSGRTEYARLFIAFLWVAPSLRRRGIGTRLLAEIEAAAAARSCRDAVIETLDDANAALYARLGWRPLAVLPRWVGRFDRHLLVKTLTLDQP